MTDTPSLTILWTVNDDDDTPFAGSDQSLEIPIDDLVEVFSDMPLGDISDEEIENYLWDAVNEDFNEKILASIGKKQLPDLVKQVRTILTKALVESA